jgi:hypothetical protein
VRIGGTMMVRLHGNDDKRADGLMSALISKVLHPCDTVQRSNDGKCYASVTFIKMPPEFIQIKSPVVKRDCHVNGRRGPLVA